MVFVAVQLYIYLFVCYVTICLVFLRTCSLLFWIIMGKNWMQIQPSYIRHKIFRPSQTGQTICKSLGTPPGFWNRVDWTLLVEPPFTKIAKLRAHDSFLSLFWQFLLKILFPVFEFFRIILGSILIFDVFFLL